MLLMNCKCLLILFEDTLDNQQITCFKSKIDQFMTQIGTKERKLNQFQQRSKNMNASKLLKQFTTETIYNNHRNSQFQQSNTNLEMLAQSKQDQFEQLNSNSIKPQKHYDKQSNASVIQGYSPFIKISLVLFISFLFYQLISRVFDITGRQSEMRQLFSNYDKEINQLHSKFQGLNKNVDSFNEDELKQLKIIKQQIKDLEHRIRGDQNKESSKKSNDIGLTARLQKIEADVQERDAIINVILSHAKENVRIKKTDIFDNIAKKEDFKQQKIRNPWALSRLNLKTPLIDTYEKHLMEQQLQKQSQRLESTYRLSYFTSELPLCVVVCTHNNAKNFRYQYNLQSILNQDYKNYKIVITDDASTDGTYHFIKAFLRRSHVPAQRYILLRNKQRMTAVPNINRAIKHHCNKQDIVVLISGDDQILGRKVFKILNAVYQTKKPAIAYTNHFYGHLHQNNFQKGYSRPYNITQIKNKNYRFIGQKFGHMRTFPVSVFMKIKEQHMKYRDGRWIQATYDQTFILPILQMACDSIEYIDQYVYLYNYGTGQNDGQINHDIQSQSALYVRELPRYECLPQYVKLII